MATILFFYITPVSDHICLITIWLQDHKYIDVAVEIAFLSSLEADIHSFNVNITINSCNFRFTAAILNWWMVMDWSVCCYFAGLSYLGKVMKRLWNGSEKSRL